MQKLEQEILSWHKETFPDATKLQVISKLQEECKELLNAVFDEPVINVLEEIADVAIVCVRLANMHNVSIADMFTKKAQKPLVMAIAHLLAESVRDKELLYEIQMYYASAYNWCYEFGYDLFEEIERKVAINKKRDWSTR